MSDRLEPLLASLERAAEHEPAIYDRAFERYFELSPASAELLAHTDELMRGRMMEQVMGLLMEHDVAGLDAYFKFEVGNHESYGAQPAMYGHLFNACREVVQGNDQQPWGAAETQAWDEQIRLLLELIAAHSS